MKMLTSLGDKLKGFYKSGKKADTFKKKTLSYFSLPLLALFLQYASPVQAQETEMVKEYEPRYETIAHERLDIESTHKTPANAYKILDNIITEAKNRLEEKEKYSKEEKKEFFETIDSVFKENGFENEGGGLLGKGLAEKKLDCDRYSFVYLAIAEEMNLPLHAVYVPSHVFVRWDEGGGKKLNWETKLSKTLTNEEYANRYDVPQENSGKGNYLENLNREETMAFSYLATANSLSNTDMHGKANEMYEKAIELNPGICIAYSNKASVFEEEGGFGTAKDFYKMALNINPNKEEYYYKLGSAFKEEGELEEAIEYFTLALENAGNDMLGSSGFPHLTDSYLQRGIAFKKKGELKKALEDFDRAAVQDFVNPLPYKYRSIIHAKIGNEEEAQNNLKTYNRLTSESD